MPDQRRRTLPERHEQFAHFARTAIRVPLGAFFRLTTPFVVIKPVASCAGSNNMTRKLTDRNARTRHRSAKAKNLAAPHYGFLFLPLLARPALRRLVRWIETSCIP